MDYELIVIEQDLAAAAPRSTALGRGLTTLLVESAAPGGQMSVTAWVENYPGVPEHPDRTWQTPCWQGQRLQEPPSSGPGDRAAPDWKPQNCGNHPGRYTAGAVVLAMGGSPRKLALPEAERFLGRACPTAPPATACSFETRT